MSWAPADWDEQDDEDVASKNDLISEDGEKGVPPPSASFSATAGVQPHLEKAAAPGGHFVG